MHIWTDIVTRELAMLVTLFALGIGAASFLGQRFDAAARLALAPVLGLCVGACVFTTLGWFFPARDTFWLLPILAVVSLVVASRRALVSTHRDEGAYRSSAKSLLRSLGARDALALAIVCIVVAAPLSYTLHEHHSVGLAGFEVWDTDGYVGEIDGMEQESISQAQQLQPPTASPTRLLWFGYARGTQQLDAVPLSANVNALLGLHATDTQTLFLIVFLVSGALGAFAVLRYAAPKPAWIAPLAGLLFAGPFFLQLMSDGSQAAICGLTLILPIAALGADSLRRPRLASLTLLALLAAGLMALYPLFVPGVALSAAVVLLVVGGVSWWRGQLTRRTLARAAAGIGLVLALSVLFDVVGFLRDVRYWRGVLNGAYYIAGFPQYHLPYSVLPGWLLQTREFYFLTELGSAPVKQVLIGVILPLIFIAVIVFGLKRHRSGLILVPLVLVVSAMAEYTSASHHCSYCTDRTLLPIAPLGIGLLVLGVAALATAPAVWLRWSAVAVAAVALVAVGERTRQERLRFADGSYYLESGNRALLSHLPPHPGPVNVEGYGEDPAHAPGELPLVYFQVAERNHEDVSLSSEYTDYSSLAYLGGPNAANSWLKLDYRYVLTRLGGVQTGRAVIARAGPLALEERTSSLDATVVSGLAVPPVRLDGQGLAWVLGPLHLLVVGGGPGPAWISLRFQTIVPVTVPGQSGVRARFERPGILKACVRATGTAPLRRGTIRLSAPLLPGVVPDEPFAVPEPPQGVQLIAMRAVTRCSLRGTS
jgi:hypothetical protein